MAAWKASVRFMCTECMNQRAAPRDAFNGMPRMIKTRKSRPQNGNMTRLAPVGRSPSKPHAGPAATTQDPDPLAVAAAIRSRHNQVMTPKQVAAIPVQTLGTVGTLDPSLRQFKDLLELRPTMKLVTVDGATHGGPFAASWDGASSWPRPAISSRRTARVARVSARGRAIRVPWPRAAPSRSGGPLRRR